MCEYTQNGNSFSKPRIFSYYCCVKSHSASCQSPETNQEDPFFQLTELQEAQTGWGQKVKIFRGFKLPHTSDSGYNGPLQFPKLVSIIWFGRCEWIFWICYVHFQKSCLLIFARRSLLSPAKYKYGEHLLVPTPAGTHSGLECPEPRYWWTLSPFLQFHQQGKCRAPLWRTEELNRWKMLFISDNSSRKIRWKPKHPSALKKHLSLNWQRGRMRLDFCVSPGIAAR